MNKIWSEAEKQYVKDNAGKMRDQDIATELTKKSGRKVSLQAVRKQRQKLGIAKKPGRGICSVVQGKVPQPRMAIDICAIMPDTEGVPEETSEGVLANVDS